MKILFIFISWISLMAQQITPYPYPNYDEDLLAKEIVNGTYMASINMLVKNSQTGEERYVHIPDSPPVVEKLKSGNRESNTKVESVSDTKIYNRDKSLEDAVLPKYVDVPDNDPTIISFAMCPQSITYVDEQSTGKSYTARYNDGTDEFLARAELTDDKGTADSSDDVYTFWRYDGTNKTEMFSIDKSVDGGVKKIDWLYSVGGRNFFYGEGEEQQENGDYESFKKIYEYDTNGYNEITKLDANEEDDKTFKSFSLVLKDGDDFYVVFSGSNSLKMINIDNEDTDKILIDGGSIQTQEAYVSALGDNYLSTAFDGVVYIEDGTLYRSIDEDKKKYSNAFVKVRFDYHTKSTALKYNLKQGIVTPKTLRPSVVGDIDYLGIKEGYISINRSDNIIYTTNFKKYVDTGISRPSGISARIVIFSDYIYVTTERALLVLSVEWGFKTPDGRYVKQFSEEGLTNKYDYPIIGD